MADRAEGSITIGASAQAIMEVIAEFESYPEWSDVRATRVVERGPDGRATAVEFEVTAPVIGDTRYVLAYEYDGDGGVSWTTTSIEGKIRDIQGEYVLEELDEDETRVTYRLGVELAIAVPGFLKRQGEKQIVKTALDGLKRRVESR
ncbi:MAG: SRPBCC family protein [Actinobacteria bacterium]|nr:SRPBCC family protein [Actinomycetota bacterium]